jgi:hypothetical protein
MPPAPRPFGVSLLSILIVIGGALNLLGGALLLVAAADESTLADWDTTSGVVRVAAVLLLVLGLVGVLVGVALRRGSNLARTLVALIAMAQLGLVIWSVLGLHSSTWYQAIAPAAIYLIVAFYLYTADEAKEYFSPSAR